jgi:hypothetical protein
MAKTYKLKSRVRHNLTKKNVYSKVKRFGKDVAIHFLEMLLLLKLFHWKTHSFSTHKATDELYATLNANMDKFIEVFLGKTDSRLNFAGQKSITLTDINTVFELKQKVMTFKVFLIKLTDSKDLSPMSNVDLLNIRDEILGDMNQFLYLLSLD